MDKFLEFKVFAAVVDAGSFIGASDALDMSKPAVSRHLAELESRMGVRLLHRTTRRLSLTQEGSIFYARCKDLLASVEEAESEIITRVGVASGLVRINAPLSFGIQYLAPLWGQFRALNPKVELDITLSDRIVDIVEDGFDIAVRIAVLPDSAMISRRLSSTRLVLCASPEYLSAHGTPTQPADLLNHAVIAYSLLTSGNQWSFDGPDGKVAVLTRPCITANNGDTCREAALCHQGIVLQPSFLVHDDLRHGRLVELMPAYQATAINIYAVYPTRRHVPLKVSKMVDFLVRAFNKPPWEP